MAEPQPQQPAGEQVVQDLSGTTVGRYAIRARLGAGGMGEVYRADDTKLKRPVALKRVSPQLHKDERYRQRLLKEAERASRLSYDHIAGLYDVLEENGEIFLVLEYVEGETLRERLHRPLSLKEFLPIARQCVEALAAAHQKGIVHRDIKPENIMLTAAGQVKILDFGVAKRMPSPEESATFESTAGETGTLSGTPAYMAPEVLLEREPDGRADIFSLGVVFYEALAGRHPFRADTFVATSDRILHEIPPPLSQVNPQVPAELERIVGRMLAKEPAHRYATAADLSVDLGGLEGARPIQAWRSPPPPRPWYRRRSFGVATVIWAVVLVLVLGWQFWPTPPPERIRVAVLPFANQTGDERLERFRMTMTQMLVHDLTGSPNIQVFPYERLLDITRGFKAEGKDISSPEAIQAVADYSNSQFVVVPAVFAVGRTMRVQAGFRDAQTGETVDTTKVESVLSGSAEETLYSMLGELTDEIQKYFKAVGRGKDYRARPAGSRPKTATAALHLTEGRNAFAQGNYAQALDSFQRAVEEDENFALAYAWMGQIYGLLGYDDKARELSERAARLIHPGTPITDAYFIEANLADRRYDYSAAEEKYLELIRLYPDEAVWRVNLAEVYEKQGQYGQAMARYQEGLRTDSNYIVVHQKLGALYSKTGNLPQAHFHVEKALSLYRALGNQEGEASALVELADIFRLQGEWQEAQASAQSALELFQSLPNEFGILWATKRLGDVHFSEGNQREARRYYQRVLSTSGRIRNNRLVAQTLMNVGVTYQREGDLAQAVEYYERSLAQERLYGEYKDWPALRVRGQAMTNLGSILIEYGPEPERGWQLAQEAVAIFQMMGDTRWEARNRMFVGLYYMNTARYEPAINNFRHAQALSRSIDYKAGLALSTYNLGRCYFFHNEYEKALESVANALTLFAGLEDPFDVALSQILLGWIYARLGDSAQARALLEEGLRASEEKGYGELLPDAYTALGELYRESGEKERARHSFQRGSDLWKEPNVSESSIEARSHLGVLEAEQGNWGRAVSYCRASVARARQLQHVHTLARTLINLARVYLLRRNYGQAIDILKEITSAGDRDVGLELRAQAFYIQGKAFEGGGKTEEAETSYQQAREAIRTLQQTLAVSRRGSFAARREIQVLLP